MVAPAAFPIAKLGVLIIKQINKPLARNLVKIAEKNQKFRNWIVVPLGQFFHYAEMKLKLKSLNNVAIKWKGTKIPKLNEQEAVEQGSNLLSEIIIVNLAADILIYEYKKQSSEKQKEEDMKKAERERLRNKLLDLEVLIEKQNDNIHALAKKIMDKSVKIFGKEDTHTQRVQEILKEADEVEVKGKREITPLKFPEEELEEKEAASEKHSESAWDLRRFWTLVTED